MRSLVIGSAGNIGRPLCSYLRYLGDDVLELDIKQGYRPEYLVGDINHPVDLLEAFDWGPEVVYLLAGMVSRVTCEQAGGLAIETNLAGVNNVAQLCKRADARLVNFSTSEVYGPDCDPMDEELSVPQPNNRYGLSKLLAEQLIEYEVAHHGLKAVTLRPFMIYGENEDWGDHRSAMIRFVTGMLADKAVTVHRGAERSWLHISDAVQAIERASHLTRYTAINIGHPEVRTMWELAELIRKELRKPEDMIGYAPLPERMTLSKRPVLKRQEELLGFIPEISLEAGVHRVCVEVKRRCA